MLISEKRLKFIIGEEVGKRYLLKELSETDAWAEIVKILGIPPKPTKSQHKEAWNKWINDKYDRRGEKGPRATKLRFDTEYVSVIKDMPEITGNGPYERVYSFLKVYGQSGGAKGSAEQGPYAGKYMTFNITEYDENWDKDVRFTFDEEGLIDLEKDGNNDQMWDLVNNLIDSLDGWVTDKNIDAVSRVVKKLRPVGVKDEDGDVFHALEILATRYDTEEGDNLADDIASHEDDMSGKTAEAAKRAAARIRKFEDVGAITSAWRNLLNKLMESNRREKLQLILRHVVRRQKQQANKRTLQETKGKLLLELDPPGGYAESDPDDPIEAENGESQQTEEEIDGTGEQKAKKSGSKKKKRGRSGGSGSYTSWTGWPMKIKKGVKGTKTNEVGKLQAKIGTKADGYFGSNTLTALKAYTKEKGKEISEVGKEDYKQIIGGKQLGKPSDPALSDEDAPPPVETKDTKDTKGKKGGTVPPAKARKATGQKKIKYNKKSGSKYIYQAKGMNIKPPTSRDGKKPKWWRWAGGEINNVEMTTRAPIPWPVERKWLYQNVTFIEADMGNYDIRKDRVNWEKIINFLADKGVIKAMVKQRGTV